ncbi:hypothetical protein DFH11DRAFT_1688443 [Phellopilus nigrolimitatus]|nr:hypothetical protein DFH11DRAFT_1688443 [Phellopilus nigrolimitatus]
MFSVQDVPFDVLPLIIGHLTDGNDLYAATLVSKAFYRAATPVLYEDLDSRLISSNKGLIVHHPAETLLKRPELALYVRSIKESGTVHSAPQCRSQNIHELSLRSLRLCTSLRSFSWIDDNFLPDDTFLFFLDILKTLPLQKLTIRTFGNLGSPVWEILNQFKGLRSVSIFCMEGPPRILQGWSETLGPSLTYLELGRCSGVPATILISVFSHLKNLTHLRIKGAPSPSIPFIVSSLPLLTSLDTDYSDANNVMRLSSELLPMPLLTSLTLRTSSVDNGGPQGLWQWARQLIPVPSLRDFRLHSFATLGETSVPRQFILFLAQVHRATLERFVVGTTQLLLRDVECLCDMFPGLTELSCAIPNADGKEICDVTKHAYKLRSLRLNMQWFQSSFVTEGSVPPFSMEDAKCMMLRDQSQLRLITIGPLMFKAAYFDNMLQGQWVYDDSENAVERVRFQVQHEHVENVRSET